MQSVSRESSIEALAMLPLALDRLSPQIDSSARDELLATVIMRDRNLLQRLPRPTTEQNSAEIEWIELRAHLAEQLRALPEAGWTHHFLIGEEWYSAEELLACHVAEDCIALRQLLEIAAPIEAESDAPKVLHARQMMQADSFSRQRIRGAMPHHLRANSVVIPARKRTRWQRVVYFFFEAIIEDWRTMEAKHGKRASPFAWFLIFLPFLLLFPMFWWFSTIPVRQAPVVMERAIIWFFAFYIVSVILAAIQENKSK